MNPARVASIGQHSGTEAARWLNRVVASDDGQPLAHVLVGTRRIFVVQPAQASGGGGCGSKGKAEEGKKGAAEYHLVARRLWPARNCATIN